MLALLISAAISVPAAEQAVILKSAGFSRTGGVWRSGNCKGAESDSYEPGAVDTYRDLNGDGRPEAVVTEGGAICYGMTGTHFWLLSKQASGGWKRLYDETAMPEFLATKGISGWPDIVLGGPRFCFAVMRWNGKIYALNRFEYDGKRCRPSR
jgi:hypothetical protein